MKKIYVILFTVFLNSVFLSCNPESLNEDNTPQLCCGENGEIPPPPPEDVDGK
ncbi:hypothetical protein [uncultured Winogradskyella sp.]|uniref:hypothetical protein n=1 Tax=uncultured Winogradskyella sp. TaxID=395353 RepID=UPI002638160E|nr:hypothetical protein [uncultured Winogradskyella sp.]